MNTWWRVVVSRQVLAMGIVLLIKQDASKGEYAVFVNPPAGGCFLVEGGGKKKTPPETCSALGHARGSDTFRPSGF